MTTHDDDVDRFRHSLAYADALNRWLDDRTDLDAARLGMAKVEYLYESSPDFVDDVETWRRTSSDAWVEAEAAAEPRIQSSFEDDRRYEWDD